MSQFTNEILDQFSQEISEICNISNLNELRRKFLGKGGVISQEMSKMGSLSIDEKKSLGQELNLCKKEIQAQLDILEVNLTYKELGDKEDKETLDVSAPTRTSNLGRIHLMSKVTYEVIQIFEKLGFEFASGPQIENSFYNFEALNIPKHHPAREMQDTFYLKREGEYNLLRTHTSSVQIRYMQNNSPPYRMISLGKVYRCDSDATHTPMFSQIEALGIDKTIHMGHLKWVLRQFLEEFFGVKNISMRFRPSYFPFTEPSAELDIGCIREKNRVTISSKPTNFLEILGCGMVHPNVLSNVNIDSSIYQGFAFGIGIERLAMLKYGAADLRNFYEGDVRWNAHYGFLNYL